MLVIISCCSFWLLLLLHKKLDKVNGLKKINIRSRTCYYFDDIIKIEDFDFDNILLDEKSNEIILAYDISYKTLIGAKLLCIRFNKVERFMVELDI